MLAQPAASTLALRDRGLMGLAFGRTAEVFHAGHTDLIRRAGLLAGREEPLPFPGKV